ncbi:MAG: FAD-dependent monooxygenase, partial [Kofleriaceae bacterium]
GIHDAMNLGWKLARVVHGTSPVSLLESYQAERHPAVARVLKNTMAATALGRSEARIEALFATVSELLKLDEPRKHIAGLLSGLDVHYELGEGHPLLGRRMPDLELVTADGPQRVFSALHAGEPVLIDFGDTIVTERVRVIRATYTGAWELPVIGTVAAPSAVLIRPDGHVAWVGEGTDAKLADALVTWC